MASQDSYTAKCEVILWQALRNFLQHLCNIGHMQPTVRYLQSYRWGLLGNAVSVPVAQWIGKALSHPYTHKYVSGPSDTQMLSPDPGTLPRMPVGLLPTVSLAL